MLDYQLKSGVEIERVPYGEKGRKCENLISIWHAMYEASAFHCPG